MAALESLEPMDEFLESDFSKYAAVYISYGSKDHTYGNQKRSRQTNPVFLEVFCPYLSISIDPEYKEFRAIPGDKDDPTIPYYKDRDKEEEEVQKEKDGPDYTIIEMPLETQSDEESIRLSKESNGKKTAYYCKTEFSAKKIAELTVRLVKKLKPEQRVFFVNFIKFRHPNQSEIDILRLVKIEPYLGPFQKDYYEWGGYLYPTVIIKHSPIQTTHGIVDIFSLLGSDTIYNNYQETSPTTVLERMISDISKKGKLKNVVDPVAAEMTVLQSVIDITGGPLFVRQEIALLHASTSGGKRTRKRRRRRKTRRKVWR